MMSRATQQYVRPDTEMSYQDEHFQHALRCIYNGCTAGRNKQQLRWTGLKNLKAGNFITVKTIERKPSFRQVTKFITHTQEDG